MSVVTYTTFNGMIVGENRAGALHDYMSDSLGSTYALIDDTQTMTDTFTYWPYGEIMAQTGTTDTPFTFCGPRGYYYDSISALNYVRARYFTSALGKWMTVDPRWPHYTNAYGYCLNNPLIFADPSGRYPVVAMTVQFLVNFAKTSVQIILALLFHAYEIVIKSHYNESTPWKTLKIFKMRATREYTKESYRIRALNTRVVAALVVATPVVAALVVAALEMAAEVVPAAWEALTGGSLKFSVVGQFEITDSIISSMLQM